MTNGTTAGADAATGTPTSSAPLGAPGDRCWRKLMLVLGVVLLVPVRLLAVLVGGTLVFFLFPRTREEEDLLARYDDENMAGAGHASLADAAGTGSLG